MGSPPWNLDLARETETLRRIARGVLVEPALADDAVQDAWLASLRRPQSAPSAGWLSEAVRRISKGLRRREARFEARERAASRGEAQPSSLETAARLEVLRELVRALEELPEPYRTAVRLRYLDDLPPRAVAERLGVPVETARTQIKRGIGRLRASLDAEHSGGRDSLLTALLPLAGFESAHAFTMAASASAGKSILVGVMGTKLKVAALLVCVLSAGWWWTRRDAAGPSRELVNAGDKLAAAELATLSPTSGETLPTPALEVAAPSNEPAARRLALPKGEWVVRGRVLRGQTEPFPGVQLRLKLVARYDGSGETLCDELLQSDEHGDFVLALHPPAVGVRMLLSCAAEGVIGFESEEIVRRGSPAPQAVLVHLYPLDLVLRGRVLDSGGAPIPGALVRARGAPATCDASGAFEVRDSSFLNPMQVEARAPGFAANHVVVAATGGSTLEGVELRLDRGARLHGHVLDEHKQPILGAQLSVQAAGLSWDTKTDDAGGFEFEALPKNERWISLSVEAQGYSKLRRDFEDGRIPEEDVALVLRQGIDIPGLLLDEHGAPCVGATVVEGESMWVDTGVSAITDDEGRFLLRDAARGSSHVGAQIPGFEPLVRQLELPEQGAFEGELRLELRRGLELFGRVFDPLGAPVRSAAVYVRDHQNYIDTARAISDENGRFKLTGLPASTELSIEIGAEGFVRFSQPIDPRVPGEQRFLLEAEAGLAGRVIDAASGAALTRFSVRFVPAELEPGEISLTGYDSRWVVEGKEFRDPKGEWSTSGDSLSAGQVTALEIRSPGYGPAIVARAVACIDPESQPIVVALGPAARVGGKVIDARDGAPIAGARVVRFVARDPLGPWYPRAENEQLQSLTDLKGEFAFDGLPIEPMSLFIEHAGHAPAFDGPFAVGVQTAARNITMQSGARITGVLRDHTGRALAGQPVNLLTIAVERQEYRSFELRSDERGAFVFEDLAPGTYQVGMSLPCDGGTVSDLMQTIEIAEPRKYEVEVRPHGDCAIVGRWGGAAELPHECLVFAQRVKAGDGASAPNRAAIATDGRFELRGLEAGTWRVTLQPRGFEPSGSSSAEVVLSAQREESVVLGG